MIDLISTTSIVLGDANYRTTLVSVGQTTMICFEDDTIMGYVSIFDDVAALLSNWRTIETHFLNRFSPSFASAGDKAWNVYSVFLCAGTADEKQTREISQIEENLELTRKIAAAGLASQEDVIRALLAVLPIQYTPRLDNEDATARLQVQISAIAPAAASAVLNPDISPENVVALLAGQP